MNVNALLRKAEYFCKLAQDLPAGNITEVLTRILSEQLRDFVANTRYGNQLVADLMADFPQENLHQKYSSITVPSVLDLYIDTNKLKNADSEYAVREALAFRLLPASITVADKNGAAAKTDPALTSAILKHLGAIANGSETGEQNKTDLYTMTENEIVQIPSNYKLLMDAYKSGNVSGTIAVKSAQNNFVCNFPK